MAEESDPLQKPVFETLKIGHASYRCLVLDPELSHFDCHSWGKTGKRGASDFGPRSGGAALGGIEEEEIENDAPPCGPPSNLGAAESQGAPPPRERDTGRWDDEVQDDDEEGVVFERDGWIARLPVSPALHKFIIGAKGARKKEIEQESGAQISVPPRQQQPGRGGGAVEPVVIRCREKKGVLSAKAQIEVICEREVEKLPFTHFISLPLTDADLKSKFEKFKQSVLDRNYPGVDHTLFMPVTHLHFTLCMLRLHSDDEIRRAVSALKQASPAIYDALNTQTLLVRLKGLHYMNDDPSAVDVVFTTDADTASGVAEKVNRVAGVIYKELREAGLLSERSLHRQRLLSTQGVAKVKLHATLMNTKYRKAARERGGEEGKGSGGLLASVTAEAPGAAVDSSGRETGGSGGRESIDAQALFRDFGSIDFGIVRVPGVHLSRLDRFNRESGYYADEHSVHLP
uniref:K Homology domain-containing protein n=1 Tax=Chromera velia CCMP2878 TaxID=1169474 RepID=A0A0G4GB55_9ALVE|eukprot:Cvel_4435.t1-p1 / transcript=Cvel_4435.t1 / gene=Cvel_4435 / organism=Chromera_velia_CCMP2878 / gene_product=Activating signal cointegrator 1 complex subunit 1, putative / transcript_product=Activating signal cointegrator 1 complex subunit 1, putative / location=Cvel_scaffold193:46864-48641(-) / protein_length=457 / sequence_SO=supercontig / SO=protein_coding / is_pseudo=false